MFGLLIREGKNRGPLKNIGDYVQSIAQRQFLVLNAKYLKVLVDNNLSNEQKIELADKMLKNYANAKFVLTSRLQVSYPCLAVHTKNIFVTPFYKNEEITVLRYTGRLKGLEDTVTIMELQNGKLIDRTDKLPCKMN